MTYDELRDAAIECLAKAFKNDPNNGAIPVHVVQAAVVIVTTSGLGPKPPRAPQFERRGKS